MYVVLKRCLQILLLIQVSRAAAAKDETDAGGRGRAPPALRPAERDSSPQSDRQHRYTWSQSSSMDHPEKLLHLSQAKEYANPSVMGQGRSSIKPLSTPRKDREEPQFINQRIRPEDASVPEYNQDLYRKSGTLGLDEEIKPIFSEPPKSSGRRSRGRPPSINPKLQHEGGSVSEHDHDSHSDKPLVLDGVPESSGRPESERAKGHSFRLETTRQQVVNGENGTKRVLALLKHEALRHRVEQWQEDSAHAGAVSPNHASIRSALVRLPRLAKSISPPHRDEQASLGSFESKLGTSSRDAESMVESPRSPRQAKYEAESRHSHPPPSQPAKTSAVERPSRSPKWATHRNQFAAEASTEVSLVSPRNHAGGSQASSRTQPSVDKMKDSAKMVNVKLQTNHEDDEAARSHSRSLAQQSLGGTRSLMSLRRETKPGTLTSDRPLHHDLREFWEDPFNRRPAGDWIDKTRFAANVEHFGYKELSIPPADKHDNQEASRYAEHLADLHLIAWQQRRNSEQELEKLERQAGSGNTRLHRNGS